MPRNDFQGSAPALRDSADASYDNWRDGQSDDDRYWHRYNVNFSILMSKGIVNSKNSFEENERLTKKAVDAELRRETENG